MRELNELGGGREEFGKGSGDAVEESNPYSFFATSSGVNERSHKILCRIFVLLVSSRTGVL
jgi:hypothetical protein